MKHRRTVLLAMVFYALTVPAVRTDAAVMERDWEASVSGNYNTVNGAGSGSSFLTEEGNLTERLSLTTTFRRDGGLDRIVLDLEGSSDERIEPAGPNLKRFYYMRQFSSGEIRAGDVMGVLSPYTFNRGLKGLSFSGDLPYGFSMSASGGMAKSKWEYLWKDSEEERLDVSAGGIGLEREFGGILETSLNFAYTDEDALTEAPTSINRVTALGVNFTPASVITVMGEYAGSVTLPSAGDEYRGSAQNYRVKLRFRHLMTRFGYEKVEQQFNTLSGAASPDKEKYSSRLILSLGKGIKLSGSNIQYRNNLEEDSATDTRYVNSTRAKLSKRGLLGRRNLTVSVDGGLNGRKQLGRDKDIRNSGAALSDRFGPVRISLNYDNRYTDDFSSGNRDISQVSYSVSSSGLFRAGSTVFRPGASLRMEKEKEEASGTTDTKINGGINLSLDFSRTFGAHLAYNTSAFDREGSGIGDIERNIFSMRVSYSLNDLTSFNGDLRISDNSFEDSSRNYRENTVSAGLVQKF